MTQTWLPGEPGDDELETLFAAARDAWRGEPDGDADAWRPESGDEAWRGAEHLAEWPESQAGPEYWMYKRATERD
jgi:hypothetical protein